MRSLPPPISSFSRYSATDQRTGRPNSANVWLNATRWPNRSVSAMTPSQSRMSALATAYPALPTLPKRRMCAAAMSMTAARTCVNRDGGSQLSRSSAPRRNARFDVM